MADTDTILMAQIGAPHGVRGEVRLKPFGENPLALADLGELVAADGTPFRILSLRPIKGEMLVVRLAGVDSRDAAQALNGTQLYISRDRLPPPDDDEFYHADLIGCSVLDPHDRQLGEVVAVANFGAGDLLDIRLPDGRSMLVPFSKATVPVIEPAARRIVVDLPPGLHPDSRETDDADPE